MARKPVKREDINPSYDEIVKELTTTITNLIMENTMIKIMIKKLEAIVGEFDQQNSQDNKEF
jgi:regulator of replication initiation timing